MYESLATDVQYVRIRVANPRNLNEPEKKEKLEEMKLRIDFRHCVALRCYDGGSEGFHNLCKIEGYVSTFSYEIYLTIFKKSDILLCFLL